MALSRAMKNVLRGNKGPKSGDKSTNKSVHPEGSAGGGTVKQFKQTGNKKNPKAKATDSDGDTDSSPMKLII